MVIDPKVRQNRIQQMTHLYELITKDNEEDKEILYKTLKEGALVDFKLLETTKGLQATDVTEIELTTVL